METVRNFTSNLKDQNKHIFCNVFFEETKVVEPFKRCSRYTCFFKNFFLKLNGLFRKSFFKTKRSVLPHLPASDGNQNSALS